MVSEAEGRVTFTKAEATVMAMLAEGPCELAKRTERFKKRPAVGEPFEVRTVEQRVVKALVRAGYARVDLVGHVHRTGKATGTMP
jgi:hypothetical protein